MDSMSTEGSVFRKLRERLGLSQEEMAKKMGTTRGTLVNLENGRTHVVTGSVLKFCEAAEVSLLEVITDCYPEFCGNLLKEDARYKELLRQTVDEYEDRLEAKDKEIQKKDQMYALLQETALTQQKLISIYESGSGKKD
ncbi:MAG: helix-turn-helix transcriptional regulator [Bacteroidales bacterium]|jgi:transcriptional regulator with XRE-family HTH domain|nr:helix-turn-helix transcriptional regulator [Bacteroidales bacterium]